MVPVNIIASISIIRFLSDNELARILRVLVVHFDVDISEFSIHKEILGQSCFKESDFLLSESLGLDHVKLYSKLRIADYLSYWANMDSLSISQHGLSLFVDDQIYGHWIDLSFEKVSELESIESIPPTHDSLR